MTRGFNTFEGIETRCWFNSWFRAKLLLTDLLSITMTSSVGLKVLVLFLAISVVMAETPELDSQLRLRKLADTNNEFALNLYQMMAREGEENIFFSPLGITNFLAMLLHGAKGKTQKEIREVLCFEKEGLSDESVQNTFKDLMADTYTTNKSKGYILNSASRILIEKSVEVFSQYKKDVEQLYNASIQSVDFKNKASEIKEDVNKWIEEQTQGKIKDLLDDVNPGSVIVPVNAMYFKGFWEIPFDPKSTTSMPFYTDDQDTEPKNVDMMANTGSYFYSDADDYAALRMPYKSNEVDMLIVLPKKPKDLPSFAITLTPSKLKEIINDLKQVEIEVFLPKFKIEYSEFLKSHLYDLGWNSLKDGTLDLTGMSETENIPIDQIVHKAFIEVNEEGTEAVAGTGEVAESEVFYNFHANRPFVFAIMNRKTNMILFMGQVAEL